jgi:hypothetical protein
MTMGSTPTDRIKLRQQTTAAQNSQHSIASIAATALYCTTFCCPAVKILYGAGVCERELAVIRGFLNKLTQVLS